MSKKNKKIRYRLEYIGFIVFYYIFRLLPFNIASNIGGFLGRSFGKYFKATKTARKNLELSMPELSETEREEIITKMWENLGRNVGEFPHMDKITADKVKAEGLEHIPQDKTAIFASAHYANWEVCNVAAKFYVPNPVAIYRKANNPFVEDFVRKVRLKLYQKLFTKGKDAMQIIKTLKKGHNLCLLVDQKMNNGIPVDFFGRPAMTAPAVAHFAKRYKFPIIPSKVVREGRDFKIIFYPPLDINEGDTIDIIMTKINKTVEQWIREKPEWWFWVHNRWGKFND